MAGEITATTSTLAGLMERLQAQMSGQFLIQSRLFRAPGWWVQSLNSSAVQFPKIPAPSPVSEHSVEADVASASAVTIGAATATLGIFTKKTTTSKLAILGGQNVDAASLAVIMNDVTAGVDKHIASVATEAAFTGTPVADVVSLSAFQAAKTALQNTGYSGPMWAFMTEYMLGEIMADMRQVNLPQVNEDYINSGYRGRLLDVPIYTIPSSWAPNATTSGKKNGWLGFSQFGIGLGYHKGEGATESLMHPFIKEESLHFELSGTAYVRAVGLSATGGILLLSDSATL